MTDDSGPVDARVPANGGKAEVARDSSRRLSPRVEASNHGSVTVRSVSYIVEVCDVSRHGAQIRLRQGLVPTKGQMVTLQFVSGTSLPACVIWTNGTLVGLKFDEPLSDTLDGVYFDDLGSEYFLGVLRIQSLRC